MSTPSPRVARRQTNIHGRVEPIPQSLTATANLLELLDKVLKYGENGSQGSRRIVVEWQEDV
jgi:hypothetical protein